jgi:uncharacterized membrane protein
MPDPQVAWSFEHSVECDAPAEFAWAYWTDVPNWRLDADVESVEIDGPFAAGARGRTRSKSSGVVEWRIVEAEPRRAVIEAQLPGAALQFCWRFDDVAGRTRMTQCCLLQGEQAGTFAEAAEAALKPGIPAGMRKLAESIERAAGTRA